MRCGPGSRSHVPFSNAWKTGLLLFPILGISLAPATAGTGGVERAQTWLAAQLPALIAATNTPIRVLAATALALPAGTSGRTRIVSSLRGRQDASGFWTRPGSPFAVEDQTFTLRAAAGPDWAEGTSRGSRALLSAQREDGGWSPTLGQYDHADAVSTALALAALRAAGTASNRSLELARTFLDSLRDEVEGSYGYESRGLGTWGSTAAAFCGRDRVDFDAATAWQALADPMLLARKPRRPLVESLFLADMTRRLPATRTTPLHAQLLQQIAAEQAADGRWPAPRRQHEDGDAYATALTLLTLERLEQTPIPPPAIRPFVWTRGERSVSLLLALPAVEPEMMLLDLDGLQTRHLVVACDAVSLDAAIAGPLRASQVQICARDRLRLSPESLLAASNYVEWVAGVLSADGPRRAGSSPAALRAAREAWLNNDLPALSRSVDAMIPAAQKQQRSELQKLAGSRLREILQTNESCLVVLDAWLACGEAGVLAGLERDGWRPRE